MNQSDTEKRLESISRVLAMIADHLSSVAKFAKLSAYIDDDCEINVMESYVRQQHGAIRGYMQLLGFEMSELDIIEETIVLLKKARAEHKEAVKPH